MTEEFIDDIIATTPESPEPTPSVPTDDAVRTEPEGADKPGEGETDTGDQTAQEAADDSGQTIEELASQLGWKPNHTGENYVDASTFILRSKEIQDSMKDHNKDLKNQLTTIQGSVDALKEHNERVYKADVTRMQGEIDRLRKEKKAAIEMADVDKVDELEQEISGIEKNLNTPPKQQPATNPIYDDWVKDNDWYLTNNEMATYADQVAQQYAGAPLERLYPLVRNKVAEVFPEHFEPAAKTTPGTLADPEGKTKPPKAVGPASPVEGGKKSGQSNNFSKADLTSDQQAIMNQFVKSGIMTEDQYVKDIAKLQEA